MFRTRVNPRWRNDGLELDGHRRIEFGHDAKRWRLWEIMSEKRELPPPIDAPLGDVVRTVLNAPPPEEPEVEPEEPEE